MPLPKFLTNIIGGKASDLITSVGGVIDKFVQTKEEKDAANLELEKLISQHAVSMEQELTKQMESEDRSITDRWKSDMESDSWLSKNTRPLVMLALLAFFFVLVILDSSIKERFEVKESYVNLLESLLITVVVAYFGSRGVEKFKTIHESGKRK